MTLHCTLPNSPVQYNQPHVSIPAFWGPALQSDLDKWQKSAWFQSLCPSPPGPFSERLCNISQRSTHSFPTLQGLTFQTARPHPPQKCVRSSCPRWTGVKRGRREGQFCADWVSSGFPSLVGTLSSNSDQSYQGNAFYLFPFLLSLMYFPQL